MKKLTAGILAVLMLAGCASGTSTAATAAATTEASAAATEAAATTTALKAGIGSFTTVTGSDATTDKDGKIQVSTYYCGVVLDGDTVKYVYWDNSQNSGTFDTTGKITNADKLASPSTKKELGSEYGMKAQSGIGKEWDEQVSALEDYATGKTTAEVLGMATETNSEGSNVATDLKTSVTIGVDGFLASFKKAVANAVEVTGEAAKVGVASSTSMSGTDASADASGKVQSNVDYAIVVEDKDGTILYLQNDISQQSGKFTTAGAIDGDLAAVDTKKEKGDNYGMKSNSAIGKEWYEQNAAWEQYVIGKKVDAIINLATETNEEGSKVATDLKTSVTIGIDAFQSAAVKADASSVDLK